MNDLFWQGRGVPRGQVLFGTIGEENTRRPGTYRFSSTDGFVVNDAHVLSPDADIEDAGEFTKPRAGSPCVALTTTNGAQVFVIGFQRAPRFDEESDEAPVVGDPDDNKVGGDKVYQTAGGARIILKRGGAVAIEATPSVSMLLNPVNNRISIRSSNLSLIADGYESRQGRAEPGSTNAETLHRERFSNQLGNSFDRVQISHGSLPSDRRRQLEINGITVAAGNETSVTKYREYIDSSGNWVGEGPSYKWGGSSANEPYVLGLQLVEVFNELFDLIRDLKVSTILGPSTPPIPPTPVQLEQLRAQLSEKILSTYLFATKNPATLT